MTAWIITVYHDGFFKILTSSRSSANAYVSLSGWSIRRSDIQTIWYSDDLMNNSLLIYIRSSDTIWITIVWMSIKDHIDQSFHQQWIIDMIIGFISFISVLIVQIYFFACRLTIHVWVRTDQISSIDNFLFRFSVNRVIVDQMIPFFGDSIWRALLTDI